jgi:hypothetical protein
MCVVCCFVLSNDSPDVRFPSLFVHVWKRNFLGIWNACIVVCTCWRSLYFTLESLVAKRTLRLRRTHFRSGPLFLRLCSHLLCTTTTAIVEYHTSPTLSITDITHTHTHTRIYFFSLLVHSTHICTFALFLCLFLLLSLPPPHTHTHHFVHTAKE